MKCQDLMNPEVRWVAADASVMTAAQIMRDQSLELLLVSGAVPDVLMGIVTDRDLALRVCAEGGSSTETRVRGVASPDVTVCIDTEEVSTAEKRMREFHRSRLVVVDQHGVPVGVLSLTDILHGDMGWRALKTARGVMSREAEGPHQPIEQIQLTASTPEDEEAAEEAMQRETVHGGTWRGSMKEFPG